MPTSLISIVRDGANVKYLNKVPSLIIGSIYNNKREYTCTNAAWSTPVGSAPRHPTTPARPDSSSPPLPFCVPKRNSVPPAKVSVRVRTRVSVRVRVRFRVRVVQG